MADLLFEFLQKKQSTCLFSDSKITLTFVDVTMRKI